MDVEAGRDAKLTQQVTGTASNGLAWYVNGIEDGKHVFGTIIKNSPVNFVAPGSVSRGGGVMVGQGQGRLTPNTLKGQGNLGLAAQVPWDLKGKRSASFFCT